MALMRVLKYAAPKPIKAYFAHFHQRLAALEDRLTNLETAVDCLVQSPKYEPGGSDAFNGQHLRKEIFTSLLSIFNFKLIVETGTYLGHTTGFLAERSGLPVHTAELDPRFFALAKTRLSNVPNIYQELIDSRQLIARLGNEMGTDGAFFYLDAHWYDDLPLKEEIALICDHWKHFVIMIDDFRVPDDEGYGYDDYGPDKILSLELVRPLLLRHRLSSFFPSRPSSEESGARRGCVLLTRRGESSERLTEMASLRVA
jgi:hypothetical protein